MPSLSIGFYKRHSSRVGCVYMAVNGIIMVGIKKNGPQESAKPPHNFLEANMFLQKWIVGCDPYLCADLQKAGFAKN
jgi:hypothetical protein